MINNQSLSFEAVKADLITAVQNKPEHQKWLDFVATGAGVTVIEMIASLATYKSFQSLVDRRESYIGTAQWYSSVQELAFNRGYMQSPTTAAEITIGVLPTADFSVTRGDIIGEFGEYQLLADSSQVLNAGIPGEIVCVVGNMQTIVSNISGVPTFQKYEYAFDDPYIASKFEQFIVDSQVIELQSELNSNLSSSETFMLRRVVDNVVKIYSGNGVIGYSKPTATTSSYQCVTYGVIDTTESLTLNPALPCTVQSYEFSTSPSYGLSTEELRIMALYYPLGGKIAQDRDYENVILKYNGGSASGILDVFSWNDNPNQHVHILTSVALTLDKMNEIRDTIDSRRQLGIQVFYVQYLNTAGEVLNLDFRLSDQYNVSANTSLITEYISTKYLNRFFKTDTVVSSIQIAIDITQLYGFPCYPAYDQQVSFVAGQYIGQINVTTTLL